MRTMLLELNPKHRMELTLLHNIWCSIQAFIASSTQQHQAIHEQANVQSSQCHDENSPVHLPGPKEVELNAFCSNTLVWLESDSGVPWTWSSCSSKTSFQRSLTLFVKVIGSTQWFSWPRVSLHHHHAVKNTAFVRLPCVDLPRRWARSHAPISNFDAQHCMKCSPPPKVFERSLLGLLSSSELSIFYRFAKLRTKDGHSFCLCRFSNIKRVPYKKRQRFLLWVKIGNQLAVSCFQVSSIYY